jgi:phage terminase large subunit-like protein
LPGRYRRRFYAGEYIEEIDNALWTAALLETCRDEAIVPNSKAHNQLKRIAVGVDPSGGDAEPQNKKKDDTRKHDDIGIVVAGKTFDGRGVVLEDATGPGTPKQWATNAVAAYKRWNADVIVAEGNFGGEMVRSTIQGVDANVPVELVHASRAKHVRAEPISALYEDRKVDHAGTFIELEDELCNFNRDGYQGDRSPNRADACVWALTELLLGEHTDGMLGFYRNIVEKAKEERERARK